MVISDFSIYAKEPVISESQFQNLYLTFPLQFKISLPTHIPRTKSVCRTTEMYVHGATAW